MAAACCAVTAPDALAGVAPADAVVVLPCVDFVDFAEVLLAAAVAGRAEALLASLAELLFCAICWFNT
jgi:hypothetical protein